MKPGRNDPCPCGSGKKYKKCCQERDDEKKRSEAVAAEDARAAERVANPPIIVLPPGPPSLPSPSSPLRPARVKTPLEEKVDALWTEFETARGADRLVVFGKMINEEGALTDDVAYDALALIHEEAVKENARARFTDLVDDLRVRLPDLYDEMAQDLLTWKIEDALAEGRESDLAPLVRQLAVLSGKHYDLITCTFESLQYHGMLSLLIEGYRLAWKGVEESEDIFDWAKSNLVSDAIAAEIFERIEKNQGLVTLDAELLEKVKFYLKEPYINVLEETISDLQTAPGGWKTEDFSLTRPTRKKRKGRPHDDDDDDEPLPGVGNLSRLVCQFVGYAHRTDGISLPRGQLVRSEISKYLISRSHGELNPRLGMMEQALHPKRKLPKAPPPLHPLCPEPVTLEVYLSGMMGFIKTRYEAAVAFFLAMPTWVRFLETQHLIDAGMRRRVLQSLLPLHGSFLESVKGYTADPALYREMQNWPADAAKDPVQPPLEAK